MKSNHLTYNYFNFKILDDKVLLSNDCGGWIFLSLNSFNRFISQPNMLGYELLSLLKEKYFLTHEKIYCLPEDQIEKTRINKSHLFHPTSLFIIVVNENCNSDCIYCQASSHISSCRKKRAMNEETLEKILDFIIASEIKNISIEFQGGEPLLSFHLIKHAVNYINRIDIGDREISISVVSNLSLLTEDIAIFFKANNISVSFSLDGDENIHNYNRRIGSANKSFELTKQGLKLLREHGVNHGAIQTTTRIALPHAHKIVDAYSSLGLKEIFVRPLTRLGAASDKWETIGYTADEFLSFYNDVLDYIFELEINGHEMKETTASIFLSKIFNNKAVDYMDLRSPCGACIGQMAFDPDGNVYSCDEGRMLSYMGDNMFMIGNVYKHKYADVIKCDKCGQICAASITESSAYCSTCVYLPYCGICPVLNYHENGNMFSVQRDDYRCKIYKGILDKIFSIISSDDDTKIKVLKKWVEN